MVERKEYLQRLIVWKDEQIIKVNVVDWLLKEGET